MDDAQPGPSKDIPPPKRGLYYTDEELFEILTRSDSDDEFIQNDSDSESDTEAETMPTNNNVFTWEWEQKNLDPTVFAFDTTRTGCTIDGLTNESKSDEFCKAFFTEDIVNLIVTETNKFHKYVCENQELCKKSRLIKWKDTNVNEMWVFFAVQYLMPRVKKLTLSEYWTTDTLLATPAFSKIISRDRFFLLLRMLHFSDNNLPMEGDSLVKIRVIVDSMREQFRNAVNPNKQLCIDESLLLFKGRLFFKQYIPSKRHRFGIKFFVLCDSITGFILDFIVYTGATTDLKTHENFGKSADVILTLLEPYLDKRHVLYCDNWYTSPDLFAWLHNRATGACGTVRKNRKNMPQMVEKLQKGEFTFRSNSKLFSLKYCDKREVYMLSTVHSNNVVDTGSKDRLTGRVIIKPQCITDYNSFMGSVDKTDMLLSSTECVRKTTKWYKKVFFHIMDMALLNAHVLYTIVNKRNIPLAKFQMQLIRDILEKHHIGKQRTSGGRRSLEGNPLRLTCRHFPSRIPPIKNRKAGHKKCFVCTKHKVRKETSLMCRECDVPLCVVPCFERFHTIKHI